MRKFIVSTLLLICCLYLTGCTSLDQILGSWVNTSKENLIINWGVPDGTSDLESGKQLLTYKRNEGFGDVSVTCIISFTINNSGFVDSYHYSNCLGPVYQNYPRNTKIE